MFNHAELIRVRTYAHSTNTAAQKHAAVAPLREPPPWAVKPVLKEGNPP